MFASGAKTRTPELLPEDKARDHSSCPTAAKLGPAALFGRLQSTVKPTDGVGIDGIYGSLCFVDHSAFRASQCPVLEPRSPRYNTQDIHRRLARRTARTYDLTGRKLVCELRVRHEVLLSFSEGGSTTLSVTARCLGGGGNIDSLRPVGTPRTLKLQARVHFLSFLRGISVSFGAAGQHWRTILSRRYPSRRASWRERRSVRLEWPACARACAAAG